MVDPFTAVSLAGNIVQFIGVAYKILSDSFDIYKSGTNTGNIRLELITDDLVALSQRIEADATELTVSGIELSAEDAVGQPASEL